MTSNSTSLPSTYSSVAAPAYDRVTIALHWAVAAAVLFQWFGAHTIDWFPKGALRVDARSVHIIVGTLLAGLLSLRIVWRTTVGRRLPTPGKPGAVAVAKFVHTALYATMVITVMLGIYNTWVRGDSIFGLFKIPEFGVFNNAARHQLANSIVKWHRITANTILALAGLHSSAALFHQYILRDQLLGRMLPKSSRHM